MLLKCKKCLFFILIIVQFADAQSVRLLSAGTTSSFRGLSVVDDKIVWVSGSNGTVGRSIDGGKNWNFLKVSGFEKRDFRDIEAFDENNAIIMAIDAPALILKTNNGGESWHVVFKDERKGMFLDAMEFWNEQSGIVIGDPIDGRFFVARTFDGGNQWQVIPTDKQPIAENGEACFASSGTNIRVLTKTEAIFISGGQKSNVFVRDEKISIPTVLGKESTGANSIAIKNKKTWMIAGGDFTQKDSIQGNLLITKDGGAHWQTCEKPPHGYRSCVEHLGKKKWITCGLNGIDISKNNGKTFEPISQTGFHVCRKAKKGKAVFFAGGGGKIGVLE